MVAVAPAPPAPHLPRPELDLLGITYRRVPVMFIDGEAYFDTPLMAEVIEEKFSSRQGYAAIGLPEPASQSTRLLMSAFDLLGSKLFGACVGCLPEAVLGDKNFVKDVSRCACKRWQSC